jgi:hypothetical protein
MDRSGGSEMAELEEELSETRRAMADRSAPYQRALALLPSVLAGGRRRFLARAWAHRRFHAPQERPMLLLVALRHEALADGSAHPLWHAFASPSPRADSVTAARLAAALDGGGDRLEDALAHRRARANDAARAVAWLWPAALVGASARGRPLALCDVCAIAGLNLVADDLSAPWTVEGGNPLPVATGVAAISRLGLDPDPLDVTRQDDVRWLRACIPPGEAAREAQLDAAVAAFRTGRTRPDAPILAPVDARDVPTRLDLLSAAARGILVLAFQTSAREDLAPDERADYEAGMRAWVGTHPPGQALWVELSASDGTAQESALVARARAASGEVRTVELARFDLHPARLHPNPGGVAELRGLFPHSEHAEAAASP